MPFSGSVFQWVRQQLEQETSTEVFRPHFRRHVLKRGNLMDGELVWITETDTPAHNKKQPFRLARGEKHPLTPQELECFADTMYGRGFKMYIYEGQLRVLKNVDDPTDPRSAVRQGRGTLFYPNGALFDGRWHHGKRHGVGRFSSHKGYSYTGDWCDDVATGTGYEVFSCQSAIDATYLNFLPEGDGVMLYNPRVNAYRYEGKWHEGRRHGKGVIFYANGDTFAGTFKHGKRHGRGVTTQTINGREIQYETEWWENKLVGGPNTIPRALRTKKPVSTLPYNTKGHVMAADITKWTVEGDTLDITFEHFMQLKLGFEELDAVGCGLLPLDKLHAVWPESNINMLEKLEAGDKNHVELLDIFSAWYPNIEAHNIARFIQEFISPFEFLRLRGYLNGIEDKNASGYFHVCNNSSPLGEEGTQRPPLHLQDLEANHYRIGGETFTSANYAAARQLRDPPQFLDVLEVWYPNVLRVTLEQYEMDKVESDIIHAVRIDFTRYAHASNLGPGYLLIEDFVQAEAKYRKRLLMAYQSTHVNSSLSSSMGIPTLPTLSEVDQLPSACASSNAVEAEMRQGFLKGSVMWLLGNRIRLSVSLLREIENFGVRESGRITLDELLRFCFPNVPCLRTQEILLDQRSETPCKCSFCKIVTD